jgi:two-component system NarL family sensor kinase
LLSRLTFNIYLTGLLCVLPVLSRAQAAGSSGQADALIDSAIVYESISPDKARSFALEALALATQQADTLRMGIAHLRLGVIERNREEFAEAQTHIFDAIRIFESIASYRNLVKAEIILGNLYLTLGNSNDAIERYMKAMEGAYAHQEEDLLPNIVGNLALAFENKDDYRLAKKYYLQVLHQNDSASKPELFANTWLNLGSAYLNIYRSQEAKHESYLDSSFYYTLRARNYYIENSDSSGVATCYLNQGLVLEARGEPRAANRLYHAGLNYLQNANFTSTATAQEMYRGMIVTYAQLGEADSLKPYLFTGLDSMIAVLIEERSDERFWEEKAAFDLERKEAELNAQLIEAELRSSRRQAIIIILIILTLGLSLTAFLLVRAQRLRNRTKNIEIEKLIQDHEVQVYSAQLEGREKERHRVAEDLHDRIGGLLATMNLQFEAGKSLDEQQAARVKDLLRESIATVRAISHDLADGRVKEKGLIDSIRSLKDALISSGKLIFELFLDDYPKQLTLEQEKELFKIVLELLSNSLKHAQANTIVLQINTRGNLAHFSYEDDGKGFDVNQATRGMGLKNLRGRVDKLKGTVQIDSKKGAGTSVIIEFPL